VARGCRWRRAQGYVADACASAPSSGSAACDRASSLHVPLCGYRIAPEDAVKFDGSSRIARSRQARCPDRAIVRQPPLSAASIPLGRRARYAAGPRPQHSGAVLHLGSLAVAAAEAWPLPLVPISFDSTGYPLLTGTLSHDLGVQKRAWGVVGSRHCRCLHRHFISVPHTGPRGAPAFARAWRHGPRPCCPTCPHRWAHTPLPSLPLTPAPAGSSRRAQPSSTRRQPHGRRTGVLGHAACVKPRHDPWLLPTFDGRESPVLRLGRCRAAPARDSWPSAVARNPPRRSGGRNTAPV